MTDAQSVYGQVEPHFSLFTTAPPGVPRPLELYTPRDLDIGLELERIRNLRLPIQWPESS